jgi:Skp family chaperone for outer membrane proteins
VKAVLPVLAASLLFFPAKSSAQQIGVSGIRLACFSPQRAFADSEEGKAGLARLKALQDKRAREIEERNKTLQSEEQALQQMLTGLTEEARSQRSKEVEKFRLDTQRFVQDAQAEVLGLQRDIASEFVARLRPAVAAVAKDKGLQLIFNLDEATIAWADTSMDITAEVVKRLARAPGR